jgi:hypothetical protein
MVLLLFAAPQKRAPRKKASLPSRRNLFKSIPNPSSAIPKLRQDHANFTALAKRLDAAAALVLVGDFGS